LRLTPAARSVPFGCQAKDHMVFGTTGWLP
jgi:hypothetical protein